MGNKKSFVEDSYYRHETHLGKFCTNSKEIEHAKTWLTEGTVDEWRHDRTCSPLKPIISIFPQSYWLTVGDGRYGLEANFLERHKINVLATDISDALLKIAKEKGFIKNFKKENAEALSFRDEEFDFVFCKESFHHFPRPMIALYEMIRVAKKGVILIEPNDTYSDPSFFQIPLRNIKNIARRSIRNRSSRHDFEPVGNYVYRLSRREIEKAALGMNLKTVAFKGMNDYFFKGVEKAPAVKWNKIFLKLKFIIWIQDLICRLKLLDYTLLTAVIFKEDPSEDLRESLRKSSYKIIDLPRNPYIDE